MVFNNTFRGTKIINEKYQDQLAEGIVQGVLSYLDSKGISKLTLL